MNRIFLVLFLSLTTAFAQQNDPKLSFLKQTLGNWYEPTSNKWEYGFFEEFAIVKGEFWDYQQIKQNKIGYDIVLSHTDQKPLKLSLTLNDKGFSIGKGRNRIQYHKVDKYLPAYTTLDTSTFVDTKFSRVDTVTIRGYLRNNTAKDPFSVNLRNWLTGEYDIFYGDVDSLGRFVVKIPLSNTSEVFVDWKRNQLNTVLSFGDDFFLYRDLKSKETIVSGTNQRLHNELLQYAEYIKVNAVRPKTQQQESLKDTSFLNFNLTQLEIMRKIDASFIQKSSLSERAKYYIQKKTDFGIASHLMQHRFNLNRSKNERFSEKYMSTVKREFFDKKVAPVSLIRENHTFFNDYVNYYDDRAAIQVYPQLSAVMLMMVERGTISVSDKALNYAKWFQDVLEQGGEVDIDKYLANNPGADTALLRELDLNRNILERYIYLKLRITDPAPRFRQLLGHEIAELYYVQSIFQEFRSRPYPIPSLLFDDILLPISNDFLEDMLRTEQSRLQLIVDGKLKYEDNLKSNSHLKETKDADMMLSEILTPHRDKVVYIDFWGTWCPPCLAEMDHVPQMKKSLAGKDVVFIYFANRTPHDSWTSFIKSKDLEGVNTIHYNLENDQQGMIERRLKVNKFPTYILVNRKGEFVNMDAPRPSEKDRLIREIDKLLAE